MPRLQSQLTPQYLPSNSMTHVANRFPMVKINLKTGWKLCLQLYERSVVAVKHDIAHTAASSESLRKCQEKRHKTETRRGALALAV